MDRNLKIWEVSLLFGLLVALVAGSWISWESQSLADSVIRLHVIANSDCQEDQAIKLQVRDQILEELQQFYPENASLEEATAALQSHLDDLQVAGQAVITQAGLPYSVETSLTQCYFPTKEYEDFSLPAGEYTALRITLGEGTGANWWCVAFPPLCLGAASDTIEEAVAAGLFTPEQEALITEETEGYILKFKSMELLGLAKAWLAS